MCLRPGTACTDPAKCYINATTVSMPIYDFKDDSCGAHEAQGRLFSRPWQDDFDFGLWPVTASEFRSPAEIVLGPRKLLHVGAEVPSSSPVKLCNRPP